MTERFVCAATGGTTDGDDLARAAEDDAKPLLSPSVSCHEVLLGGGALELLSDELVAALGIPPVSRGTNNGVRATPVASAMITSGSDGG